MAAIDAVGAAGNGDGAAYSRETTAVATYVAAVAAT
jgi:hypothetical protein